MARPEVQSCSPEKSHKGGVPDAVTEGVDMKPAGLFAAVIVAAAFSAPPGQAADMSKGEYLARAGNCLACHTMSEGVPYAGGLRMQTPVGVIYTTNITPDPETGIGRYTLQDFDNAVRKGVAKNGQQLYPAMPYPSYAKITDEDIRAMYDFFIKEVKPVRQKNSAPEMSWPMNMRWPLAAWNYLMTNPGAYVPSKDFDAEWNRGAYLVQGLGHCGACHTPRGWAQQEQGLDERDATFLTGSVLDNWAAPNLRNDMTAGIGRWTEEDIASYLKTGHSRWGGAYGTMREVVAYSTSQMTDGDVKAIAKYLKSLPHTGDHNQLNWVYNSTVTDDLKAGRLTKAGSATYLRQCASCHGVDGKGVAGMPPLAGNSSVVAPDPVSLIRVVLNGTPTNDLEGAPEGPGMPQFRSFLKDQEIADVVSFIRTSWGNRASTTTTQRVGELRKATDVADDRTVILRMK